MTGGGDISANREFKVDSSSIVTIATPQTISGIKTFSNEMVLSNVSAPGVTTNKLYATSGRLYWNGFLLDSDAAGGGEAGPHIQKVILIPISFLQWILPLVKGLSLMHKTY